MTTVTNLHTTAAAPEPEAARTHRAPRLRGAFTTGRTHATRLRHIIGIPGSGLAIAVLVFSDLVSQALQTLLDSPGKLAAALTGVAGVVLLLGGRLLRRIHPSAPDPDDYGQDGTARLATRRGLVLLTGLDSADPGSAALRLLASLPQLEYLAIIGTPETADKGVGDALTGRLLRAAGRDLPAAHIRRWEWGHSLNISNFEQATAEAIRWMLGRGLDPAQIVLDVSAGRRTMGFGATKAADAFAVETQLAAQQWDTTLNRPIPGTATFKIICAFD